MLIATTTSFAGTFPWFWGRGTPWEPPSQSKVSGNEVDCDQLNQTELNLILLWDKKLFTLIVMFPVHPVLVSVILKYNSYDVVYSKSRRAFSVSEAVDVVIEVNDWIPEEYITEICKATFQIHTWTQNFPFGAKTAPSRVTKISVTSTTLTQE